MYVHVLRSYRVLCKKLSTTATTPIRSQKNFRPRRAMAVKKRYTIIALECGRFVEADYRASIVEKKSGHTLEMFRTSAHGFYSEKHNKEFEFEGCYDFLKGKGKFFVDHV